MQPRNQNFSIWNTEKQNATQISQRDMISAFSLADFERLTEEQLRLLTNEYINALLEKTTFKNDEQIVTTVRHIEMFARKADVLRLRNAFYLIVGIVLEWEKFNTKEKSAKQPFKPFPPVERNNMARWLLNIERALNPAIKPEVQDNIPYRPSN